MLHAIRNPLSLLVLVVLTNFSRPAVSQECGFGPRGLGGIRTGTSFSHFGPFDDQINDVAMQPDGKIVAVGQVDGDMLIVRYDEYGIPDPSFSGDGVVRIDVDGKTDRDGHSDRAAAVAIQPSGRILVVGTGVDDDDSDFALIALTPTGGLDPDFGAGTGKVTFGDGDDQLYTSIAIDPQGGFWVAGQADDPGFFGGAEWDLVIHKYDDRGRPDHSFDNDGVKNIGLGHSEVQPKIQVLSNGKVAIGGYWHSLFGRSGFFAVRLHRNGAYDSSLDHDGKVGYDYQHGEDWIRDFLANDDGSFYFLTPKAIYGYDLYGDPMPGFGTGGVVLTTLSQNRANDARSFVRLASGKIVVAGTATAGADDFALTGFTSDGRPDLSFGDGTGYVRQNIVLDWEIDDEAQAMTLTSEGKLLVAGTAHRGVYKETALARFYPDGSLDRDCVEPEPEVPSEIPGGNRSGAPFRRGDANSNGTVDLTDVIYTLDFLFIGDEAPGCMDALDSNNDAVVDLSDATRTLGFLFLGKAAPPAPFDKCGRSLRRGPVNCLRYDACSSSAPTKDLPIR